MGRRPNPSLALSATVRQWFDLTQAEIARALGVSSALLEKVEAGTRSLPRLADERLYQLALLGPGLADPQMPPPLTLTPTAAATSTTPAPPERWLATRAAAWAAPPPPHMAHSPLAVARQALRLHLLTREIGALRAWLPAAGPDGP